MPPALAPVSLTSLAIERRRSGGFWQGAWAARSITGPAAAALIAWPYVAVNTPLDQKPALAACAAGAATASIAVARRRRSAHRERMRRYRLSRGVLGDLYPIDAPLPGPEGVFRLGVTTEPGHDDTHELQWRPWDGDPPNAMFAGSTGGGKTEAARLALASALAWGWDVEVIDLKGSTEYHPLPVHDTTATARDCLARVMADLRRRGALLRETERAVTGPDGRLYDGRPRNFREVPIEQRQGFRSRLVLVDEAALMALPGSVDEAAKAAGQKAIGFLQAATALTRSLGIHVLVCTQRPDADLLPGFTKNNLQARLLLGKNDDEAQRMTLTNAVASAAVAASDVNSRPPGRCVAVGIGTPEAILGHVYLLHETALLRALDDAGPAESPASADDLDGPPFTGYLDARAPAPARTAAAGPDLGYLPASPRPGVGTFGPPPAGLDVSAASAEPSTAYPSASVARRLRPPVARALLRVTAWRLLVGPLRLDPPPRPSGLRQSVLDARAHRCLACGDTAGPFDVEHWRPRSFGGSDRLRNLWLCCRRCHAAKSSEEATVRRWRARVSARALARVPARVPAWAWPLIAAALAGVAAVGPVPLLVIAAVVIAARAGFVMFRRDGLDGLPTLDARLEMFYGGPIGAAARWRTQAFATAGAAQLYAGALAGAYLAGIALRVWWAVA